MLNKAVSKLIIKLDFGTVLFIMEIISIWKFYLIRKCVKKYKNKRTANDRIFK